MGGASVQEWSEHEPKPLRVLYREEDVRHPHGLALPSRVPTFALSGRDHFLAQFLKAVLGYCCQKGFLVCKMVVRGGVGHSRLLGGPSQREPIRSDALDKLDGRCHERTA